MNRVYRRVNIYFKIESYTVYQAMAGTLSELPPWNSPAHTTILRRVATKLGRYELKKSPGINRQASKVEHIVKYSGRVPNNVSEALEFDKANTTHFGKILFCVKLKL
jgi:hypothetical protein